MKGTVLGSLATFSLAVVITLFQEGETGRTIKLPHYDVTFSSWPLMEVTRTGSLFKAGKPPRGGRIIQGPVHPGGYRPHSQSDNAIFRLGPPPTPSKLLLISPKENKGRIHKHLQETLKHYAANKKPLNLNMPIIVRAPGPHAPPPPPGYQLGPPNGPAPSGPWRPGPPYAVNDYTSTAADRPNRLNSMLKNAAFSGIFKNTVDSYASPDFMSQPQLSGTYITVQPDGTQITTHVGGEVIPGERPSGDETQPSIPPVLKIGDPLPDNYTIVYAERQIIGMKSPDMLEKSGHASPGTIEYDAKVNLGTKYEQGYGAKPPPTHPLAITTFQKRGDYNHQPEKLVEQDLPDTGLMSTTNIVFSTPNISAPMGGRHSPLFKAALDEKQKMLRTRKKEKPLDAQVKLLGRLFTKLQRLKPPMVRVPAEEEPLDHTKSEPGGWNSEDDDGWNKVAKTKVDSPIMAVQIQTFSAPEIDSSDPDILESMAEFGTHDVEFADTDELVNLMDTMMKHGSSRVNLRDLGSNPEEINENMLAWVRRHLKMTRDANKMSHARGEEIANQQFKQYQTFVTPPFAPGGWGSGEAMPLDPKTASRSMPIALTNMLASMRGRENF